MNLAKSERPLEWTVALFATRILACRYFPGSRVLPLKTKKFRASDFMETDKDVLAYIEALAEENDPEFMLSCLRKIADAKGMTQLAQKAGLSRSGLYKVLAEDSDPKLSTIKRILAALGLELRLSVQQNLIDS